MKARDFAEALYGRAAEYLDSDFQHRAGREFHSRYWEMYVVCALLELGLPVVPRCDRKRGDRGPDVLVAPSTWIEATAVTAGTGADAVPEATPGRVRSVPDEGIKLRLLSALEDKRVKFEGYRASGVVGLTDPCVVAINAGLVPSADIERRVSRILRALLEIGDEAAVMDRSTGEITNIVHLPQAVVAKRSGSQVSQGMFLDGSCGCISACLYSAVDPLNSSPLGLGGLGGGFVLLHNPTAKVSLPRGTIKRGHEYWVCDDGRVEQVHHEHPAA